MSVSTKAHARVLYQALRRVVQAETITADLLTDNSILTTSSRPHKSQDTDANDNILGIISADPDLNQEEAVRCPATSSPWPGASPRTPYEWALLLQDALSCLADSGLVGFPDDDCWQQLLASPNCRGPLADGRDDWEFMGLYKSAESECCLIASEEAVTPGCPPLRSELTCLLALACRSLCALSAPTKPEIITVTTMTVTPTTIRVLSGSVSPFGGMAAMRIVTQWSDSAAHLAADGPDAGAAWFRALWWLVRPEVGLHVAKQRLGEASAVDLRHFSERLFSGHERANASEETGSEASSGTSAPSDT